MMPPSHQEWKLECKVYIGGLGYGAEVRELEEAFGRYGNLKNVWVARNPPGFAFVEFSDRRDAEDACRMLDGTKINGRRVRVEMSTGRPKAGIAGELHTSVGLTSMGNKPKSYSRSRSRSPRKRSFSRSPTRSSVSGDSYYSYDSYSSYDSYRRHRRSRSRTRSRSRSRSRKRSSRYGKKRRSYRSRSRTPSRSIISKKSSTLSTSTSSTKTTKRTTNSSPKKQDKNINKTSPKNSTLQSAVTLLKVPEPKPQLKSTIATAAATATARSRSRSKSRSESRSKSRSLSPLAKKKFVMRISPPAIKPKPAVSTTSPKAFTPIPEQPTSSTTSPEEKVTLTPECKCCCHGKKSSRTVSTQTSDTREGSNDSSDVESAGLDVVQVLEFDDVTSNNNSEKTKDLSESEAKDGSKTALETSTGSKQPEVTKDEGYGSSPCDDPLRDRLLQIP